MDSLQSTYILACLHLTLCLVAFLLTRYPVITIFHLAIATAAVCFGVRPILSATEGGYTILKLTSWGAYNRGLLYQLGFNLAYVLGYFLYLRRHRPRWAFQPHSTLTNGDLIFVGIVGITTMAAIHILSRGNWMPGHRGQALTMLMPGGQVLFRLAVATLSMTLPLGAVRYFGKRHRLFVPVILAAIALLFLTLLYQRGFVLTGVLLSAWVAERYRGITYRSGLILAMTFVVALMVLRPLAGYIGRFGDDSGNGSSAPVQSAPFLKRAFLFTGNFSLTDTWPVAESFVESYGRLQGATLVAIPFGMTPISFRWRTGMTTIVDRLNYFYYGDIVLTTQWGFNVNMAQNIFVNFGPGFMFLGCIPGALIAFFDRWLREVKTMNIMTIFLAGAMLVSEGLIGDTAILLSYMVVYAMVGFGLSLFSTIRLRTAFGDADPGPVSPVNRHWAYPLLVQAPSGKK